MKLVDRVLPFIVDDFIDVFDKKIVTSVSEHKAIYRIAFASLPNSDDKFTIFNKKRNITKGFNEICIKDINGDKIKNMITKRGITIIGKRS